MMKKIIRFMTIFFVFLSFFVVSCGKSAVTLPEKEDEHSVSDDDSGKEKQDETADSDFQDEDEVDNPFIPDGDSEVPDDDETEVPDEAKPECDVEGSLKCNVDKDAVLECVDGQWETKKACSGDETCDDSIDPVSCASHVCSPGTTYCKEGNVYTCATDGLSEEMTEECGETQYCDDSSAPNFPPICADQVCVPGEKSCDGDNVVVCNDEGSGTELSVDCVSDGGVCDEDLDKCVYTDEVGGTATAGSGTNRVRGVYYSCDKNAELINIEMYLDPSAGNIRYLVYEQSGATGNYVKIFDELVSVTAEGEKFYSSGSVSIELHSGNNYLIAAGWEQTTGYYSGSGTFPNDVSFGSAFKGFIFNSAATPGDEIPYNSVNYEYNQRITTVLQ